VETILAIETSVPDASVVLWRDGKIVFEAEFTSDRHHNSMVFEPVAQALDLLGGEKLSLALVGTGPGSYSGIRIGIAVAQGVAIAHNCSAAGLGSLAATPEARRKGACLAVGDARRGLYFVSPVTPGGEAMQAELMDGLTFAARLGQVPDQILFTLDDPTGLGLDENLGQRVVRTRPKARLLMDVWHGLDTHRREELIRQPLSPSYLRPPFTSKAKAGHPLLRKEEGS